MRRRQGGGAIPRLPASTDMRLVLEVAHRHVVGDGVSEHVALRVRLVDPPSAATDYYGGFTVVDLAGLGRQLDRRHWPHEVEAYFGKSTGYSGRSRPVSSMCSA